MLDDLGNENYDWSSPWYIYFNYYFCSNRSWIEIGTKFDKNVKISNTVRIEKAKSFFIFFWSKKALKLIWLILY